MRLLTAALPQEFLQLLRYVRVEHTLHYTPGKLVIGKIQKKQVAILLTSIAPSLAHLTSMIHSICMQYPIREAIVSGCCGALDPQLKAGDLVLSQTIYDRAYTSSDDRSVIEGFDQGLSHLLVERAAILRLSLVEGPLMTSPTIVAHPADKRAYHERTGAIAVDMESAGLARLLLAQGVRVASLRAVYDTFDEALPASISGLIDAEGQFRPRGLMHLVRNDPKALFHLPQTARRARLVADRLSEILLSM